MSKARLEIFDQPPTREVGLGDLALIAVAAHATISAESSGTVQ
jgi:hypothetical protein